MFTQHVLALSSSWPHPTPRLRSSFLLKWGRGDSKSEGARPKRRDAWPEACPDLTGSAGDTRDTGLRTREGLVKREAARLPAGEAQTGGGLTSEEGLSRPARSVDHQNLGGQERRFHLAALTGVFV